MHSAAQRTDGLLGAALVAEAALGALEQQRGANIGLQKSASGQVGNNVSMQAGLGIRSSSGAVD